MTQEYSRDSHLAHVAMTTKEIDKTQSTGGNSMTSYSILNRQFYMQCALIFVGIVGIVGNGLILYALVASKQHKKHALIVNQNALDLFSSVFLVVTYAAQMFNIRLTGTFGYWLCIVFLSENIVWWGTNGSMVNLAVITIDRYLKVVHPIWSRNHLHRWLINVEIAFSWFAGIT